MMESRCIRHPEIRSVKETVVREGAIVLTLYFCGYCSLEFADVVSFDKAKRLVDMWCELQKYELTRCLEPIEVGNYRQYI
jgi:hypothetical protein